MGTENDQNGGNLKSIGPSDPNHVMTVTVHLAPRAPLPSAHEVAASHPRDRKHLSRAEFAEAHGAHPDHVALVEKHAQRHGLSVASVDHARRTVHLTGTVAQLKSAFGAQVEDVDINGSLHRMHRDEVELPGELKDCVHSVLGMDTRPIARPHFRIAKAAAPKDGSSARSAMARSLTPPQVAQLYNFPTGGNGAGQSIAIIELGGGYTAANLESYFTNLGISPLPEVVSVSVDGGANRPGGAADGEVQLDIEVVGAVAPGARIVVYFAPNTNQGFIDAVSQAIHDQKYAPQIVSISWGSHESNWGPVAKRTMDMVLQSAAVLGVSVFVAAGDNGSSDGFSGTNVDFPASSPNCTACGGTRLIGSGGAIASEVTWNDGNGQATGGGVSDFFPPPPYQSDSQVPSSPNTGQPGRGVPDIAGNADPVTGYLVQINGISQAIGGTSAVAPLWAGLTALLNQALGTSIGFFNPLLYSSILASGALSDIVAGNNITDGSTNQWLAGPGWDPCTGLGSPDGSAILKALGG